MLMRFQLILRNSSGFLIELNRYTLYKSRTTSFRVSCILNISMSAGAITRHGFGTNKIMRTIADPVTQAQAV
jgi:hypothetical protein